MSYLPQSSEGRVAYFLFMGAALVSFAGIFWLGKIPVEALQEYAPAKLWFPFGILATHVFSNFWDVPVLTIFFQYPAYAVILSIGLLKGWFFRVLAGLVFLHGSAVGLCVLL